MQRTMSRMVLARKPVTAAFLDSRRLGMSSATEAMLATMVAWKLP